LGGTGPISKVRQLAEEGNVVAQWELGEAYYKGDGVPRDYAEALGWFRKAADQSYLYAILSLGDMYERGEGVPADRAEALRYYFRATDIALADLDSADLECKDLDAIFYALDRGAEHGHAGAQRHNTLWQQWKDRLD
jgi:hypothetical protein